MSKRVLRTMMDGLLKTSEEMDANSDVIRKLIQKGLIERLPQTYRITQEGVEYAALQPISSEERRSIDNARKAKQRRAKGMKEYKPRTAQTRYPRKRRETKAEAVERVLSSARSLPQSVFALGGLNG